MSTGACLLWKFNVLNNRIKNDFKASRNCLRIRATKRQVSSRWENDEFPPINDKKKLVIKYLENHRQTNRQTYIAFRLVEGNLIYTRDFFQRRKKETEKKKRFWRNLMCDII